jgi:GDP-4-dehydro-6-deoxy-D-mannose reductase
VASGNAVSLEHVVELLIAAAGLQVKVEPDEARLRPAEVPILAGDASKLRATTGWEPAIPLEQTLADVLQEARAATETMRIET